MLLDILSILVFTIIFFGVSWFIFRNIKSEKTSKKFRVFYIILQVILISNLTFFMLYFYKINNDFIGEIIIFFSTMYFIFTIYSLIFLLIRKLIISIISLIKKDNNKLLEMLKSRKIAYIIFACSLIIAIIGYINEDGIKITNYDVYVNKDLNKTSYDIVMITDTHMGVGTDKDDVDYILKKTNEINPDFIFLTGDIFDEKTSDKNIDYILDKFSQFKSKYGTYAISGNHEMFSGKNTSELYNKYNINYLEDEVVTIGDINIVGMKDYFDEHLDVEDLVNKSDIDLSKVVIALRHEPLEYDLLSKCGVDLVLSGHTHGEQLPGTYPFIMLANDMAYGLEKYNNMNAIVSSGAGQWGFKYSFPSDNEIVHIHLMEDK